MFSFGQLTLCYIFCSGLSVSFLKLYCSTDDKFSNMAIITRSPLFPASITRGHLSFSTSHDTSKHGHTTSPNMTPVSISNVSTNITVSPTTLLRTRGHVISSTTCPSEHTIRRGLTTNTDYKATKGSEKGIGNEIDYSFIVISVPLLFIMCVSFKIET